MLWNRPESRADRESRETPSTVVGAVAAGTAPLPFLAVYAVLFIVHGGVHKVAPPDITSTSHGELMAGVVALVAFVVGAVALLWMFSGARRWPFVIVQLGLLATAIDFLVDETKGGRLVSFVVALASLAAIALAFAPDSWDYVSSRRPIRRRRRTMPIGSDPGSDSLPDSARYVGADPPDRDGETSDQGRDLARAD